MRSRACPSIGTPHRRVAKVGLGPGAADPIFSEIVPMSRKVVARLLAASLRSVCLSHAAPALACAVGLALSVQAARADVKDAAPYLVVVLQDNTEIKCSDGGAFYAVARAKAGQMLRVDGEGATWLRVQYLPGMRAFVKAEDAQAAPDGKSIKLLSPSKLMAANEKVAERNNWWPLLDSALPAGTSMEVSEALKTADGRVYGYLVPAPAGSRGYVGLQTVRRATPEEAAAWEKANAPTPPAQPASGQPASGAASPSAAAPGSATPAPGAAGAGAAPLPGVSPGVTPVPTGTNAPGSTPGATPGPTGTAPVAPAPAVTPAPPELPKPVEDVSLLAEKFEAVMDPSAKGEEIDAVIAEFNRRIAASSDESVKGGLKRRLEALKLKKELLERSAKLRAAAKYDDKEIKVRQAVDAAQKQAVYTIVGRIVPSTVYDGKRGMPLMFRVEAADSASTRTIGYVVARPGIDLLTKSGKVVGILGESRFDEALHLNIVAARRVDVLNPSGVFEADKAVPETKPSEEAAPEDKPAENTDDQDPAVKVEDPAMDGK